MKILQVNATDTGGGAANACKRLTEALIAKGETVTLFSQKQKGIKKPYNEYLINNKFQKVLYFSRHLINTFPLKKYNYYNYNFSASLSGASIHKNHLVKQADIIHLHWINDSFLTPSEINKIRKSGKKIFWTLHDMWPFTGGCHYSGTCIKYKKNCGACPELGSSEKNDISRKIHELKTKYFHEIDMQIITPSKWLAEIAATSSLFIDKKIIAIPNALNIEIYKPLHKSALKEKLGIAKDKFVIIFGAVDALEDERKGFKYLISALEILANQNPELKDKILLAIFGSEKEPEKPFPFPHVLLGKLKTDEELVNAYNLADILVTPSLQDNLPTTIMEAMACEVPVVGFDIGGIPEMIDHKINGYVASPRSADDLAEGINWIINSGEKYKEIQKAARSKAVNEYSYEVIAEKHIQVYYQF